MISQEYWAPLQNVLMLLESMFTGEKVTNTTTNSNGDVSAVGGNTQESNALSPSNKKILWLVIS